MAKLVSAITAAFLLLIGAPLLLAAFIVTASTAAAHQLESCTATGGAVLAGEWRPPYQQAYVVGARGFGMRFHIIAGPCAGGAAYSPALTDFIIQTRQAHMFITGPNVIAQVTGEKVTSDELGGADAHMALSGVTHFVADKLGSRPIRFGGMPLEYDMLGSRLIRVGDLAVEYDTAGSRIRRLGREAAVGLCE